MRSKLTCYSTAGLRKRARRMGMTRVSDNDRELEYDMLNFMRRRLDNAGVVFAIKGGDFVASLDRLGKSYEAVLPSRDGESVPSDGRLFGLYEKIIDFISNLEGRLDEVSDATKPA